MIRLIATVEAARINFLPQFVCHYLQLGVQSFHLAIHFDPSLPTRDVQETMERATALLLPYKIEPLRVFVCPFDAMALRARHDAVQSTECNPEDWIVWADIDEFHEYPASLRHLIHGWEQTNVNIVAGDFLDRLTEDGALPLFDPSRPIWEQFPIGADVTKRLAQGQTRKVVCARSTVQIKYANHDPLRGQQLTWATEAITVHHFKWDASVVERLKPRLKPEWRERCHWWVQSERVIKHIEANRGRLDLTAFSVSRCQTDAL